MTKEMNEVRQDMNKEGSTTDSTEAAFPWRRTKCLASLRLSFLSYKVKVIMPTLEDEE